MSKGLKIEDKIVITHMEGEPQYDGKIGEITHIDDKGQFHGTWGGCALIPGVDGFELVSNSMYKEAFEDLCIVWDEEGCGKDHFKNEHPYLYNILKELTDKATATKPIPTSNYSGRHNCPSCKNQLPLKETCMKKKAPRLYCDRCGQKIDWRNKRCIKRI